MDTPIPLPRADSLLECVLRRPGMFFGKASLFGLKCFILGITQTHLQAHLGNQEKPKKQVVLISEDQLPEPFSIYWNGDRLDRLDRPWKFYLVDNELYVEEQYGEDDTEEILLVHWMKTCCCGVACFIMDLQKKKYPLDQTNHPMVRKNGEYLFMSFLGVGQANLIAPSDGKIFEFGF